MSYALLSALVVAVVATLAVVGLVLRRDHARPGPALAAAAAAAPPAAPSRSEVARRVGEIEADVAALRRQLTELEGSTGNQFRRLWGAVSVQRREDRQSAGGGEQLALPAMTDDEGTRPLTPDLLAQLTGQGAVASPAPAPVMPPRIPPRRRW